MHIAPILLLGAGILLYIDANLLWFGATLLLGAGVLLYIAIILLQFEATLLLVADILLYMAAFLLQIVDPQKAIAYQHIIKNIDKYFILLLINVIFGI